MTKRGKKNGRAKAAILASLTAVAVGAGLTLWLPGSAKGERIWYSIASDVVEYIPREGVLYFTQFPILASRYIRTGEVRDRDYTWAIVERSAIWGTQKTRYAQVCKPNVVLRGFQVTDHEFLWLEAVYPVQARSKKSAPGVGFASGMVGGVRATDGGLLRLPVKMETSDEKGYAPQKQYPGGLKTNAQQRDYGAFPPSNTPLPAPLTVHYKDNAPYKAEQGVVTLCRLPRRGGAVTRQALDTQGEIPETMYIAPDGGTVYYLRGSHQGLRVISDGKKMSYSEYPASCRLFRAPAHGGPAQEIADGLIYFDTFAVTEQFVCWSKRAPYPDGTVTLYLLPHTENAKPIVLTDYRSGTLPVEYKGRLYWIEFALADTERGNPEGRTGVLERRLVSALPDGGDHRIVLTATDAQNVPRPFTRLLCVKGEMYITYEQIPPNKREAQEYIARLYPDRLPVLGASRPFKGTTLFCDTDYCYTEEGEKERRWVENFDFLFAESVISDKSVTSLYRFRVPE